MLVFHIFYGQHNLIKTKDELLTFYVLFSKIPFPLNIFFYLEPGSIQKLLYSNYSDAKVVVSWEPSFYHPTHFPLYIVTINNRTTVMKNQILRFQSTNLTQAFNINVSHLATTKFRSTYMDLVIKRCAEKFCKIHRKT